MILLSQSDIAGTLIWFVVFFIFIVLYPRLMLSQMIWKLEQSAQKLEGMSEQVNKMAAKKAGANESKKKIDEFTDFFVIEPSSLDPYGIVSKIDQIIRQTESRFTEFVEEISPGKGKKEQQELNYTLRAAIGLRQLSKIVRHYVEMAKKFKNLQIAMVIQMQMPIIEKIADGEMKGAEAFSSGWPIGDSIGPLVAASLMDKSHLIGEEVAAGQTMIDGRKCFVLKATGPAPHLGRIDEAINKIMSNHKISRVVTIDAAAKLEGEKTGNVAEGVGFAMGGIGQREIIENVLLPKGKPIDSVIIKVGISEAIEPMKKEIYDAVPKAIDGVRRAVRRAKKGQSVLIIGVGNSCGIPDSKKELNSVKDIVAKLDKKRKEQEKKEKKGSWI